jgi:hypothetical protein
MLQTTGKLMLHRKKENAEGLEVLISKRCLTVSTVVIGLIENLRESEVRHKIL